VADGGHKAFGTGDTPLNATKPLDQTDRNILKVLRDNSRMSMRELARRVNVARATPPARGGRRPATGVIQGFTVRLDPKKAGLGVSALIAVSLDQRRWRSVRDELTKMPEVDYYAITAGEFDVMILVRAATMEIVRDVILDHLSDIEGVRNTKTFFILDETPHRPAIL
jgi:DNA-binding Lrp family transcriptional regulator